MIEHSQCIESRERVKEGKKEREREGDLPLF